jgi:hypothetical protein
MPESKKILKLISPDYFWDVDFGRLDINKSKRLIIERVFSLGRVEEMTALLHLYGNNEVFKTLSQINYLDPKTLNFVARFFEKPKRSFKCYTRTHSNLQHWSF